MVEHSHAVVERIIASLEYSRADAFASGLREVGYLTEVAIAAAEEALEEKRQSEPSEAETKQPRTA